MDSAREEESIAADATALRAATASFADLPSAGSAPRSPFPGRQVALRGSNAEVPVDKSQLQKK